MWNPKIENGVYRRRYNQEKVKSLTADSPNALNVTKTSRFRYAGHIIKRLEDLPLNLYSEPNPMKEKSRKTEIQVDGWGEQRLPCPRARDWMHCARDRQTWRYLLQQVLTRYWL
jgi:hypothetical protein